MMILVRDIQVGNLKPQEAANMINVLNFFSSY